MISNCSDVQSVQSDVRPVGLSSSSLDLHWHSNCPNRVVLRGGRSSRFEHHYEGADKVVKSKKVRHLNVPAYASNLVGSRIRNAVTNAVTPHTVGSLEELQYFKVSNVNVPGSSEPQALFYSSPDEYESHLAQELVSEDAIEAWRSRGVCSQRGVVPQNIEIK